MPAGPAFAIVPGVGFGPVRFGASLATVERLMTTPCEERTASVCRYITAGIEYELNNGLVSGMLVHRHDRVVDGSTKIWGQTRCAIAPDITPRVIQNYVHSLLGKPESSEAITAPNPNRTVLREVYPGVVFEYDRGEYTNQLVVGSIRVVKADSPVKVVVPKRDPKDRPPPEPLH